MTTHQVVFSLLAPSAIYRPMQDRTTGFARISSPDIAQHYNELSFNYLTCTERFAAIFSEDHVIIFAEIITTNTDQPIYSLSRSVEVHLARFVKRKYQFDTLSYVVAEPFLLKVEDDDIKVATQGRSKFHRIAISIPREYVNDLMAVLSDAIAICCLGGNVYNELSEIAVIKPDSIIADSDTGSVHKVYLLGDATINKREYSISRANGGPVDRISRYHLDVDGLESGGA